MSVSLIAAQAENRVIGRGLEIPWKVKGEQALFKEITAGGTLVMGRKTYDSIGRPLPGRTTIVITRDTNLRIDGCEMATSLEDALDLAATYGKKIFIAGGGQLYDQAMPVATDIHLTTIHATVDGDIYFPEVPDDFNLISEKSYESNINYTYRHYTRSSENS